MRVTIWHNPKCSKSRQALELLYVSCRDIEVVKYLENNPSKAQIKELLLRLKISARELMRTKEDIYKELGLDNITDDEVLIQAMFEHPKLIERPIVFTDKGVVIGRPPEKILELL